MTQDLRSEVLVVFEQRDHLVLLAIVYEEADGGAAVGQVFQVPSLRGARGAKPTQLLSTNDTLRSLWVSPSGALWVASADGNIGTTIPIAWPAPRRRDLSYAGKASEPTWSVTSLPAIKSNGLPPNVTALWGLNDADVHAGAYGGHLFHWDGKSWSQVFEGPGGGNGTIRAFGGHAHADVVAVGQNDVVMHFDGSIWTQVRMPGVPGQNIHFNAVASLPAGDFLISGAGDDGVLFQGSASQGFTELGRYPVSLIDMAIADGRVLFATGDGVAELFGRDVRMIKSNFKTVAATAGASRWFFIEPAAPRPSFIEYDPKYTKSPWERTKY